MSYPGADYGQLYPKAAGATQQFTQGIDPDWAQLAMMYGFLPNPYPAAGTEGQDQMRFLASLKGIADAQLGGANGPYNQISPNNPISAMPFGMRQYMGAMAPLFQSIQGRNLMPLNNANMFAGGYQYGPLDTTGESGLMKSLREQRAGGPVGGTPYAPAAGAAPSTTPGQAPQVSGGNTPGQTPPPAAEAANPAPVIAPATTAQQDIIAGLQQGSGGVPNVSTPGVSADRKEARPSGFSEPAPPAPLTDMWNAYMKSRTEGAQSAKNKELDFWTNPVFRDFANWFKGQLGQA